MAKIREEGFQHSEVMDIAGTICDVYGFRLSASKGMKRAQGWAKSKMEEIGLENVVIDDFMDHGSSWDNVYTSLHMLEPEYLRLNGYPLAYTPSTKGKIKRDAVIADVKTREDAEKFKGKLKNKIVLISPPYYIDVLEPIVRQRRTEEEMETYASMLPRERRRRHRIENPDLLSAKERIDYYAAEGAAAVFECNRGRFGVVWTFHRPGAKEDQWSAEGMKNSLPVISMVPEHYNRLYRILDREIPVTIEMEVKNDIGNPTKASNVIGEWPGTDLKDEIVIVGGHFDSWHTSPGATDNISGCAVALEAVRILKAIGVQPRRTIRVAWWGSEEDGIRGSRAYVAKHFGTPETGTTPDYDKFSVYFNQDNGAGQFRGVNLQNNEYARKIFEAWIEPFHDLNMTTLSIRNTGSTDHIPFDDAGLPGFQFIQDRVGQGTGHTNMDYFDNLIPDDLKKNAVMMASFVYHAAMRDGRFPRKSK